jgi:hypothetical protein
VPRGARQRAGSTLRLDHSLPCALPRGARQEYYRSRASSGAHDREGVTPSPRGRPSTPFLCRASRITHGNELCRVLPFSKTHGKVHYRVKMSRTPFAVRLGKMRTAKAVPWAHGKGSDSGSVCLELFWELSLFGPGRRHLEYM